MSLDDLLDAPLPALRDDGFSARVLLRLERTRQRQMTLLWCMIAAALLPLFWFLPLEQFGRLLAGSQAVATASPYFAPLSAGLALLWAWQARVLRF